MFNIKNRYLPNISIIVTVIAAALVFGLKIPNPNIALITVIVYFTFRGGYFNGSISAVIVIAYSIYFFSEPNHLFTYTDDNLEKLVVIFIFIPIMVFMVGFLKKQYLLKSRELELANEKLQILSRMDDLTNIYNRRYFNEVFFYEYKNALNNKQPISLGIIDIDYFKNYNDYYGHLSGDTLLKNIAQAIEHEIKNIGGFMARYGGDEFVIVLPDTDREKAKDVGNIIIHTVSNLNMEHKASPECGKITVSAGFATMNYNEQCDCLDLLNKADKALYMAKQNGKNKVEYYSQ